MSKAPSTLWTIADAAEYLGMNKDHVRRMARDGRFPRAVCSKPPGGREYYFRPIALEAWLFHEEGLKPPTKEEKP